MKFITTFLLLLISLGATAQQIQKQIDSLLVVAETANDSTRLSLLNRVGYHYIFNDLPKAKKHLAQGLQEANLKGIAYWQAAIVSSYGIYHDVSGQSDSARIYFERSLAIATKNNIHSISSNVTNNLGMYHWNRSEYKNALAYFFDALALERSNGIEKNERSKISNIGLIYQEMGQLDKALAYHNQALALREKYDLIHEIPLSLNNIAIIQKENAQYDTALTTINQSIIIARKQNLDRELLTALNTKGNLLLLTAKEEQAVPIFKEVIIKRNTLNIERKKNLKAIESLLYYYNNKANKKQSIALVRQGVLLIEEFPELASGAMLFYKEAAKTNYIVNEVALGNAYFEKAMITKDSLFSKQNAEAIASLETKFKVTEKEKALAESRANLAEKEIEINKKNTLVYGGFGLAIILGLLGYLVYNQQKLKNRQLKKEGELKTALARIETQNRLQEQRLRISRDLHDNIGSQLTFIISSIDNLKFGMKGERGKVVDKLSSISAFTTTTIYELRDTIWAMNKTEITLEDLQIRIANFIEKAGLAAEGTRFEFHISEKINREGTLTSVAGMNVYRIIQEAINNAIKYAKATEIKVQIDKAQEENMSITIADNGQGFNLETIEKGNGLNNMKKRARDIHGAITFTSEISKGTTIALLC